MSFYDSIPILTKAKLAHVTSMLGHRPVPDIYIAWKGWSTLSGLYYVLIVLKVNKPDDEFPLPLSLLNIFKKVYFYG